MANNERSWGLGTAAVIALILAVAVFAAVFMLRARSSAGKAGGAPTGGIAFAAKPLGMRRTPDGKSFVKIEITKKDAWHWKKIAVQNVSIAGQANATASLVSAPPPDPVPERFALEFLTTVNDAGLKGTSLRFDLKIEAAKHFGLSNAAHTSSVSIPLTEVMNSSKK